MKIPPSNIFQITLIVLGILLIIVAAVYGEALISTLNDIDAEENRPKNESGGQDSSPVDRWRSTIQGTTNPNGGRLGRSDPRAKLRLDREKEAKKDRIDREKRANINLASAGIAIFGSGVEILVCSLFICKKVLRMLWTIIISHVFIGMVMVFVLSIMFPFRINTTKSGEVSSRASIIEEEARGGGGDVQTKSTGRQEAFLAFLALNIAMIPFAICYILCCDKRKKVVVTEELEDPEVVVGEGGDKGKQPKPPRVEKEPPEPKKTQKPKKQKAPKQVRTVPETPAKPDQKLQNQPQNS